MFFNKKNNQAEIIFDYSILLGGLALTGLFIRAFSLSQENLLFATVPMSVGYVLWGVMHHKKHGHIDRKIFLEYALLALLVNVIIFSLVS